MEQPAWLTAAWAELGVKEVTGGGDNARVVAYYREAGHGEIGSDEVPWCAAFAGAMLKRGGIAGSGSLMARSYLAWGEPLAQARAGAIAVLERGGDPAAGHVGFVIGEAQGMIIVLGGNQSDSVSAAVFDSARVLGYRWPAAQRVQPADDGAAPSGLPARPDSAFEAALACVLELEGGFSDDPYDPGGPTNKGITLAVYASFKKATIDAPSRPRLVEALKRICDEDVHAIYRARYWAPAQCAAMPSAIALFHFDAAVNHGVHGAARMLQKALGVDTDGEIGALTLTAIAHRDPATLLADYASIRRDRYRALPHFWRFGRGWLNRVGISSARAAALIGTDNRNEETRKGGSAMEQTDETVSTGKWWAQSKTVWGAIITAAAAVVPVLGPIIGVDLSGEVIRQAGEQTVAAVQALAGVIGTLLTIYGRMQASGPLTRRSLNVRV